MPELTEFGSLWAEANAEQSIVARVALQGYTGEWPDEFVATAVRACNAKGAETAGVA